MSCSGFVVDANQSKPMQRTSGFDQERYVTKHIVIVVHKQTVNFFFVWTIGEYMNNKHIILYKVISFPSNETYEHRCFPSPLLRNFDREEILSTVNCLIVILSVKSSRLNTNSAKICKGTISSFDKKFEYPHSNL